MANIDFFEPYTNFFKSNQAQELLSYYKEELESWLIKKRERLEVENAKYPLGFIGKKKAIEKLWFSEEEIDTKIEQYKTRTYLLEAFMKNAENDIEAIVLEYGFLSTMNNDYARLTIEKDGKIESHLIYVIELMKFCRQFELTMKFEEFENSDIITISK